MSCTEAGFQGLICPSGQWPWTGRMSLRRRQLSKRLKEVKDNWGKSILSRDNSKCKGPEMEVSLAYYGKARKVHVAGMK